MTRQTLVGKSPITLAGDKLCFASRCGKNIICHHNNKEDKFKLLGEAEVRNYCLYTKFSDSYYISNFFHVSKIVQLHRHLLPYLNLLTSCFSKGVGSSSFFSFFKQNHKIIFLWNCLYDKI